MTDAGRQELPLVRSPGAVAFSVRVAYAVQGEGVVPPAMLFIVTAVGVETESLYLLAAAVLNKGQEGHMTIPYPAPEEITDVAVEMETIP